ncbi:MAG: GNAT family N-acetyltransferase [Afipia sp.]|nr:GNAT family N-acetyltransferase [Afipia sp.]
MILECPTQTLRETRGLNLETKRLTLRQPTLADVEAIAGIVGDKRVSINLRRVPHPYSVGDARDFVNSTADSGETVFLVEHERNAVGLVGLSWEVEGVPELGYCFGVDHWGKGYATEAGRAVIDFAFEEFSIDRITSGARVVNTASRHVLEKCGFNWTGVEINRFLALGSSTPVDCFKLERSIWSSIRNWSQSTRSA